MISDAYRQKIEADTRGLRSFQAVTYPIEIGGQYVFVYPDFGSPDSMPDYTAHRYHIVTVIREATAEERDIEEVGRGYFIRADDGWEGHADEYELFPLEQQE